MKKYLLILFCSIVFGQISTNQMVTFTQAQSLGFGLNAGQSHVTSIECMTKAQALSKYNLDASSMSAYTSNQLVPRSVWVTGADLIPPSYQFASISYVSSTSSSLTGSWTGWTDNIGISYYRIVVQNYTTGIVEHTSPNLPSSTSSYTATGLSGATLYYYTCWAYDAAGNTSGLTFPYTTPAVVTNSITFSNIVTSGTTGSWSGTVTITGATATFNAFATSYSGGTLSTNITVGGNSRSISRSGSGTNNSTTFTLPPGTYSYNFNVTASGGSGSAGINSYF
jgi:hypothetical protein